MRRIGLLLLMLAPAEARAEGVHTVYAGTIDSTQVITMAITREGDALEGFYRYGQQTAVLALTGTVDAEGNVRLTESDSQQKQTGVISAKPREGCLTGEWSNPSSERKLPFEACSLSKKQALENAGVTYRLRSVEGTCGANGMIFMEKVRRGWKAGGSAIEAGTRQATTFDLSTEDVEILDSLVVRVGKDQTVRLLAKGKLIQRIPFKDGEMERRSADYDDFNVFGVTLYTLSPATTFLNGRLFLTALEKVDYSNVVSKDSVYFEAKGRLVVTYVPGLDQFEIQMANMTLTFTRAKR
jgi:hypothetical protein